MNAFCLFSKDWSWEGNQETSLIDFGRIVHASENADKALSNLFSTLTKEWVSDSINSSAMDEVTEHPAYRRIVEIGSPMLPFIFKDLQSDPKPWFVALRLITHDCPIKEDDAGDFDAMLEAWLEWGRANGYA